MLQVPKTKTRAARSNKKPAQPGPTKNPRSPIQQKTRAARFNKKPAQLGLTRVLPTL
jgi:hypothetical protein